MRKSQVMKLRERCGIGGKAFVYATTAEELQAGQYRYTYARVAGAWVTNNVLRPQGEFTSVDLLGPLAEVVDRGDGEPPAPLVAEGGPLVFQSGLVPSPLGTTVFDVYRSATHSGVYRLVVTCRAAAGTEP